ncbi:MAG: aminotransferase class I/II-fold pyridoxal phosphate-dependent enzyme [Arthrobacter sp.]|uniref:aminotransferase class I/II-fold pyridoxal phosphate-dependent enzyme n=1 Tax=Arthrobacter TaxID=1663 RepID=UPI00264C666A|nr:aminotransferase class I/II-fold pyridoxal phosphate-dependent enzyme [Micrococcaceae bacterium]MDN5877943.1 aminotransferase class I/II-fold pyridoxal phosphate-dependent enzyme [Micrococcaceae bacterium]MDN5886502.1 aminotransferase class I/II-fold pyridoxal phosphate-dependent enzyme [Micrococcaceae bacterium]MDN5904647.1 aminotransferase class I/II-fold pyridoxal phosphate-dependent enzyme [Micrococcaceae bacterium]MDN6168914.1 aminotransferase class I/II-fold pyridoxal phosphate-depende
MSAWQHWLLERARVREVRGLARATDEATGLYDLASNDYLGLARDPRLAEAAHRATLRHGTGSSASRVVTGTHPVHRELEDGLCRLTGRDEALVFSSGYLANLGILGALGGPGTLLVLDEQAHASLIDGARLARSPLAWTSHHSVKETIDLLASRSQPRAVVVVESVYSVSGDAAPLAELAAACRRYDALLLVDEAHSLGVGTAGGAVRAASLAADPSVVVTATLSKALGAQGGAVLFGGEPAGMLRTHLASTARSFIFDTALAPGSAAAAGEAVRILEEDPALAGLVPERVALMTGTLGRLFPAGSSPGQRNQVEVEVIESGAGAVVSLRVGSAETATMIAAELRGAGIAVGCFRPPSVPDGISRIRLTARATQHPEELVEVLATVARTVSRHARVTA